MKKKKILLLSDDLRMHSGVATMSRELVTGTLHHYDWVQMAGAIKHPGALKKELHVAADKKIPAGKLAKASHASGTLGKRARLALTLSKLKK